jgi:hypothetical protein
MSKRNSIPPVKPTYRTYHIAQLLRFDAGEVESYIPVVGFTAEVVSPAEIPDKG